LRGVTIQIRREPTVDDDVDGVVERDQANRVGIAARNIPVIAAR
jgi:hypothetical protein